MPTNSPTTILSVDGSHGATLTPSPDGDGVWVVIKRVVPPFHTIGAWFLRCPYHLARDQVHAIVYPLTITDELMLRYDPDLRRVVYSRSNPTTTRTRKE
jgi:hypothetical protein